LRTSCTSALRSSSKSWAEPAAAKVSSESDFHTLSSFYRFICGFSVRLHKYEPCRNTGAEEIILILFEGVQVGFP
jgi:hypothetical protein